jgi:hypothetical protein
MLDKTEFLHQKIGGKSVLEHTLELRKHYQTSSADRMFYVIHMFYTVDGSGPCDIHEADSLKFLVWDQETNEYFSTDYLGEAIEAAELLNKIFKEGI